MHHTPFILVTGGAGYIGSHTVAALLSTTNYRILSVDNYSNSTPDTYSRIEQATGKKPEYLQADLADAAQVEELFRNYPGITGIIHFAAYKSVPESVHKPVEYYRNNMNSLLNVLEAGAAHGVKQFIFSSSCSIYGNISTLPVNENTTPATAESPYAYTKVLGERVLSDFAASGTALKSVALRYFNPVGAWPGGLLGELPNQRPNNLVPMITQTAIGKIAEMKVFGNDYPTRDGTCIRDYIHVCDIAEAHVLALNHLMNTPQAPAYDVFNLGSGSGVTVLEAIETFEKVSHQKLTYTIAPRRAGDVTAIYSDSRKALEILQWKPLRSIEEMMHSAWQWECRLAGKMAV
ncbi:MAG: UDP-glucose 4-epimerase GalE [Bacteroidia bacterium]|jgi:UDP-glucose 4-epimerase|nr:UDP-glucose 4-epimerase GalE [Bacteroidia bacterium]